MKMFSVHVNMGEIISKAARDIDKYDAEKQKKIRKVIADGTKDTKIKAVQLAPKGPTGNLKKGIKDHLVGDGREGIVMSTAPHSHLVEYGTDPRITYPIRKKALKITWNGKTGWARGYISSGKMPARHVLKRAAEREWPKIVQSMEKAMK